MAEWTCPHCGKPLPLPEWDDEYRRKRRTVLPLTLELLSILGITFISLSVVISVFVAYRVTSSINGNVTSRIDELQQSIGAMTSTINGNVLSQIGKLQQSISTASYNVGTSNPQASLNVRFSCVDSVTKTMLSNCLLHIRIVGEAPVSEFDIASDSQSSITIHLRRRLEITAAKDGYKTTTEIFEYVEDGSAQVHGIELVKASP